MSKDMDASDSVEAAEEALRILIRSGSSNGIESNRKWLLKRVPQMAKAALGKDEDVRELVEAASRVMEFAESVDDAEGDFAALRAALAKFGRGK